MCDSWSHGRLITAESIAHANRVAEAVARSIAAGQLDGQAADTESREVDN